MTEAGEVPRFGGMTLPVPRSHRPPTRMGSETQGRSREIVAQEGRARHGSPMTAWSGRVAVALMVGRMLFPVPEERPKPIFPLPPCSETTIAQVEQHLDMGAELLEDAAERGATKIPRLSAWHQLQAKRGMMACGIVEEEEETSEVMMADTRKPLPPML